MIPLPALTRATVKASNTHPTTSFPTPADRTMTPTVVWRSLSSVRIRARTGNAVIAKLTPIKRRKIPKEGADAPTEKVLYIPTAIPAPNPKGRIMLAMLTAEAIRAFLTMILRSTSSPTRKRKKTNPRFATSVRFGIATAGKIVLLKLGICPMTLWHVRQDQGLGCYDGPRTMPPETS